MHAPVFGSRFGHCKAACRLRAAQRRASATRGSLEPPSCAPLGFAALRTGKWSPSLSRSSQVKSPARLESPTGGLDARGDWIRPARSQTSHAASIAPRRGAAARHPNLRELRRRLQPDAGVKRAERGGSSPDAAARPLRGRRRPHNPEGKGDGRLRSRASRSNASMPVASGQPPTPRRRRQRPALPRTQSKDASAPVQSEQGDVGA